ncbi:uncharacterized protein LOC136087279 [Hydra vulgaris]|uniref:Uncharacterized protein LOC136087279 n=1 Tax=Hydra vulgaris TaxID=6087 RepID=A0ABM4CV62_HYDVU
MKTSKKSRAEIQKAFWDRQLEKNADIFREKERKRWHMRPQQKKIQVISELSERKKRIVRPCWRVQKAKFRAAKRKIKTSLSESPERELSRNNERKLRGRTKVAYRKTKAYRKIQTLTDELETANCSAQKYKKRWLRLKSFLPGLQANSPTTTYRSSTSSVKNGFLTNETSRMSNLLAGNKTPNSSFPSKSTTPNSECHRGNASRDAETQDLIREFLTRDDNSIITTGKKQTITKNKDKNKSDYYSIH